MTKNAFNTLISALALWQLGKKTKKARFDYEVILSQSVFPNLHFADYQAVLLIWLL